MSMPLSTEEALGYIGSTVGRMFDLVVLLAEYIVPVEDTEFREFVDKQREWSDYWHTLQDIAEDMVEDNGELH